MAGSFALLGLTTLPVIAVPVILAVSIAASVAFWRAIGELAAELDAEADPEMDHAEYWGVAGWPVPSNADLQRHQRPSRAQRAQLIAEIEEYLGGPDTSR